MKWGGVEDALVEDFPILPIDVFLYSQGQCFVTAVRMCLRLAWLAGLVQLFGQHVNCRRTSDILECSESRKFMYGTPPEALHGLHASTSK